MRNVSTRIKRSLLPFAGFPLAMSVTLSAHAADATDAAASADTAATVGEVVVTATRRAENIQKVPIAVVQVSAQQLKDEHIVQPVDLQGAVAGLTVVNVFSDAIPIFSLRGVSMDDIYPNDSSPVGVYYDEVYASSALFLSQPMFDMQRVEVLKGPQGTLYGRNTSGGAINFISNKPSDTFGGYVNLGYGRYNTFEGSGAVTGPILPGLNFRLAGDITNQGEGYQTDINTGRTFGAVRREAVRGQLEYKPNASLDVLLTAYGVWDHSIAPSAYSSSTYTGDPSLVTVGNLNLTNHETTSGVGLHVTWDTGMVKLTSITAYDSARKHGYDNYDGTPYSELDTYNSYWATQFSQELRLASEANPGDLIDWIVGVTVGVDDVKSAAFQDSTYAFYGPDAPAKAVIEADWRNRTTAFGVYGHTVTHITSKLDFTAGLRYSYDRPSFDGVSRDVYGGYFGLGAGYVAAALDQAHSSDNVSYRVGLDYKATKTIMAYASVATGYKTGTYYGGQVPIQAGWGYTLPETVLTEEVGFKSQFFDNRLLINAAGFNTDYTNRQAIVAVLAPTGITAGLANIPKAKATGAELEVAANPFAGFTVKASGAYVDSRVTQTITNVRGLPVLTSVPIGIALPQTAKWSYNLSGQYEWPIGPLTARLQADYSWLSKSISALGDPNAVYGPEPLLGMSAEIASPAKHWSVSAWVRNLTDSGRHTYGFTDFLYDAEFYVQKPRTYGVTLGYTF